MPHHHAASLGQLSTLQELVLGTPSLVNAKTKSNQTALRLAITKGHLEVVDWLITKAGANPQEADKLGWQAPYYAAAHGHRSRLSDGFTRRANLRSFSRLRRG